MSDRYTHLYKFNQPFYHNSAPIIIMAGALLLDNLTDTVVAQIKFKSISSCKIKAVKVSVQPLTTNGLPLGDLIQHQYLDLSVVRDEEFGHREAILLPDNTTRQFFVKADEVIFNDNTTWTTSDGNWSIFEKPLSLEVAFKDNKDLIEQYRLEYGNNSVIIPRKISDIWYCSCGSINRNDERICHLCGKESQYIFSLNIHNLINNKDERLKAEAAKKIKENTVESLTEAKSILSSVSGISNSSILLKLDERIAKIQNDIEIKRKQKRKKAILLSLLIMFVAFAVLISIKIHSIVKKEIAYQNACSLIDDEKFTEAISILNEIVDYKDSADRIDIANDCIETEISYNKAKNYIENNNYIEGVSLLKDLGDYKDSTDLIKRSADQWYNSIVGLLESSLYEKTINEGNALYSNLGNYNNVEALIGEAKDKWYQFAMALFSSKEYELAEAEFDALGKYTNTKAEINQIQKEIDYSKALELISVNDTNSIAKARELLVKLGDFKDSKKHLQCIYYLPTDLKFYINQKETRSYKFLYDDNGIINRIRSNGRLYSVFQYDSNGKVTSFILEDVKYYIQYNYDETITVYSDDGKYHIQLDKYGNRKEYREWYNLTNSELKYDYTWVLDKYNNPTESSKKDGKGNGYSGVWRNEYDDNGSLLYSEGTFNKNTTHLYYFTYNYVYLSKGEPNLMLIMQNLKRIGVVVYE